MNFKLNKESLQKLLIKTAVVQKVDNTERHAQGLKRLGGGLAKAYRLNPYNPLSYAVLVIYFVLILICFGVIGIRKEITNPFKWY